MRRVLLIFFVCVILFPAPGKAQPFAEDIYPYIVIDRRTGDILYENRSNEIIFPASITKILTTLVALENAQLNSLVTASREAVTGFVRGAVLLNIRPGEQFTLYDLLNASMLRSANDAATVVAEYIGGTYSNFITMMNERAAALGAVNSNFENPHGLHGTNHVSTVHDLALITAAALNNTVFKTMISQTEYNMAPTNFRDTYTRIANTNPLMGGRSGYNFHVVGIKTGFTSRAGNLLVSYADNYQGREVVCVVAQLPTRQKSVDLSFQLLDAAFQNFDFHTIVRPGDVVSSVTLEGIEVPLAASRTISHLLPNDVTQRMIQPEITLFEYDGKGLVRGDILGKAVYTFHNRDIGWVYLVSTVSLPQDHATRKLFGAETVPGDDDLWDSFPFFLLFALGGIIVLWMGLEVNRIGKNIHRRNKT